MNNYELKNQGRRKSQYDFSSKIVSIGYYGVIICIIGFMLYEWLK
jgi:hypothetical protein